ncbi:MAG TPA: GPP34 family phosphoprotein [Actinomycetaceae bacterium]|nr:GPP34 family phosphoprotein [Actinomycetaceae bacterium]
MATTAPNTTLTSDLLLLLWDDESGRPLAVSTKLEAVVAGAAVLDLLDSGALEIENPTAKPKKQTLARVPGAALPSPEFEEIAEYAHGRTIKKAVGGAAGVNATRTRSKDLRRALLDKFVESGLLQFEDSRALGIFPWPRYRATYQGGYEDALRERLRGSLIEHRTPTLHEAGLLALLGTAKVTHKLFPHDDKKLVKRRAKEAIKDEALAGTPQLVLGAVQSAIAAAAAAASS